MTFIKLNMFDNTLLDDVVTKTQNRFNPLKFIVEAIRCLWSQQ